MGSRPPPAPPRPPPQTLAQVVDPDFGAMTLIRSPFFAMGPGDKTWRETALVYWEGAIAGVQFQIHVDEPGAFPDIPPASRAVFLRLGTGHDAIRREVALRQLDLAKDWAVSGDLPEPTAETLAQALRIRRIDTYDDWRASMWFDEAVDDEEQAVFAGHWVHVRFEESGEIAEIALAG